MDNVYSKCTLVSYIASYQNTSVHMYRNTTTSGMGRKRLSMYIISMFNVLIMNMVHFLSFKNGTKFCWDDLRDEGFKIPSSVATAARRPESALHYWSIDEGTYNWLQTNFPLNKLACQCIPYTFKLVSILVRTNPYDRGEKKMSGECALQLLLYKND